MSGRPPNRATWTRSTDSSYWTTRGFWAIVDQALFAVSNLIINVLLARWLSPREYGAFVTAYVVLLLVGVAHSGAAHRADDGHRTEPVRARAQFKDYFSFLLRFQWAFGAAAAATLLLVGAAAHGFGAALLGSTFVGLACAAPFIFLSWLARRACYVERKPAIAALGGAMYLLIAGSRRGPALQLRSADVDGGPAPDGRCRSRGRWRHSQEARLHMAAAAAGDRHAPAAARTLELLPLERGGRRAVVRAGAGVLPRAAIVRWARSLGRAASDDQLRHAGVAVG